MKSVITKYLKNDSSPFLVTGDFVITRKELWEKIENRSEGPFPFSRAVELLCSLYHEKQTKLDQQCPGVPQKFEREILCLTSGSSGSPKVVVHTPESLLASAKGSVEFFSYKEGDVHGLMLPLKHTAGFMILIRALISGGIVKLMDHPSEGTHHLSLVPHQLQKFLPELAKINSLDSLLIGGGHCSKELVKKALALNLPLYLSYGLTEMASTVAVTFQGKSTILPGRSLEIENGTVVLSGECLAKGHYQNDDWTSYHGQLATNDLAHWNEDELIITGRNDRVIVSGGTNLDLDRLELFLNSRFPGSRVIGIDDPTFGQRPVAFIPANTSVEHERLKKDIENSLGSFYSPDFYMYLPEERPEGLKWSDKELKEQWKKHQR